MTYLLTTMIMMIVATSLNAIMDAIDHKKGAKTLYDVWHLVKHLHRPALASVGAFAVLSVVYGVPFYTVLGIIALGIFPLATLWDYIYKVHWPTFVKWDNTITITTKWRWLDARLGFGKQREGVSS